MPTFMQTLAANPSGGVGNPTGGSNIYGQPKPFDPNETLGIVNRLKDREMVDFKDKANFMSDLSLKQDRLRNLYDPKTMASQQSPAQGMNNAAAPTVRDPNAIGALDQAKLNQNQQQLNQQGKMGQEALDIKTKQEALNQQKSDQIHQQKINELEGKQADAKGKLDLATKALADKNTSADAQLKLHQTVMENTKAFHDAEMAKKDLLFEKSQKDHQDLMDNMQKKLDQASHTTQKKTDSTGASITTDTTRGSAPKTVRVQGKDGTFGTIPADKLDDWNANHAHPDSPPPALAGPQASSDNNDEDSDETLSGGQ